jgi:hypothetical protein
LSLASAAAAGEEAITASGCFAVAEVGRVLDSDVCCFCCLEGTEGLPAGPLRAEGFCDAATVHDDDTAVAL